MHSYFLLNIPPPVQLIVIFVQRIKYRPFFYKLQSFGSVFSSVDYGTSQLLGPSLESRCTAGSRVELPHINCASDHRWTYPSCGQQSMVCGPTLITNCPSFQLLHPIYCIPLLTVTQIVFIPLRSTSHTTLTGRSVAQFLEAQGRGFDNRWGRGNFSLNYSFRQHSGLGVDSDSNSNKYQTKKGGKVGLKILSRNSLSLRILET
jgi:hypothetical protein